MLENVTVPDCLNYQFNICNKYLLITEKLYTEVLPIFIVIIYVKILPVILVYIINYVTLAYVANIKVCIAFLKSMIIQIELTIVMATLFINLTIRKELKKSDKI